VQVERVKTPKSEQEWWGKELLLFENNFFTEMCSGSETGSYLNQHVQVERVKTPSSEQEWWGKTSGRRGDV